MTKLKVGVKEKSTRILKLENEVAKLKTDMAIMEYTINLLQQRLFDLEVRNPIQMQIHNYDNQTTTPTKVETHNYSYGYCYD
jgi:hypothetical protein